MFSWFALLCLLNTIFLVENVSSFGMTMTTSFLSSGSSGRTPSLPRDVKDAVSRCRNSVQKALEQRISRMEVEMPVGADFGVEKKPKKRKRGVNSEKKTDDGILSRVTLDRSDRELCRIFVEMFQPLGGEHIAAIFNEESLADDAKKAWKGDPTAASKILCMGRRLQDKTAKKKKKRPSGFAAKMNASLSSSTATSSGPFKLPEGCEVALFVSPGPKELIIIERICDEVGMGTLVVLLNARLGNVQKFGSDGARTLFTEDFENVFHLAAAPQDVAPNCLLCRAYPDEWILARKPKVGQPKVISVQRRRPSVEECKEAYNSNDIGEIEEVMEGVFENVANWFK